MSLKIYQIDSNYIKYLSQYQNHIFSQEDKKGTRKYIGIILRIGNCDYFAPLSSYKPKHKDMKESVDLIKIKAYAVININNMIPVPKGCYSLVDVNNEKDVHYRYLLQAEAREINRQRNRIMKNAEIVYNHKLKYGDSTLLAKRTNDFKILEQKYKDFI